MTTERDIVERMKGYQEIPDMDHACQRDFAAAASEITRLRTELEAERVAVASLRRKMKAIRQSDDAVPGEYEAIEAWTNGKEIVVLGTHPTEEDDPNCERHHCDSMGCSAFGPHVLVRAEHPAHIAAAKKGDER